MVNNIELCPTFQYTATSYWDVWHVGLLTLKLLFILGKNPKLLGNPYFV